MQAIYTAKCGLMAQQQRLDTIASNIANVSTTGYKSQDMGFKDALYTKMIDPSDTKSAVNLLQGSGTLAASSYRDFTAGTPLETGETLDFYIDGDGFFAVQKNGEETLYTRSGAFTVSEEADGKYLVTSNGYYVLDSTGSHVILPEETGGLSITDDGMLDFGDGTTGELDIVTFVNKDGLLLAGNGCYLPTEASGEAIDSAAAVKQGYLETSNVDISQEFSKLIRTQRAYSMAGRVLTAWNDMETETNNLR